MITHDQMAFTITRMFPQVTLADHGHKFWVGMPVEGDVQAGPAFIAQWDYPDLQEPTQDEILAVWSKVEAEFIARQATNLVDRRVAGEMLHASDELQPLKLARELGNATKDEELRYAKWSAYLVALSRIKTQPGYPDAVEWPTTPSGTN